VPRAQSGQKKINLFYHCTAKLMVWPTHCDTSIQGHATTLTAAKTWYSWSKGLCATESLPWYQGFGDSIVSRDLVSIFIG